VVDRDRHGVSEEVGLILRVAGVTAQQRLLQADQLVTRLPATVGVLEVGGLHPVQVQRLSDAVITLTDEQCVDVQARMLARVSAAPSMSIAGFARALTRVVIRVAPKTAEQAHTDALAQARVEIRPLDHGMALLLAWLPADDALRIKAAINARAHVTGPAGVDACQLIDARRAHALTELIELGATTDPASTAKPAPAAVQVTVSLQTLLAVNDEPAELNGYGPIPASMARLISADPTSTWRRLVTDPLGKLINYGRTRYPPPPRPRRLHPRPRPGLHLPQLPPPRHHLRTRPRPTRGPRRTNQPRQPHRRLPPPPPPQTQRRLDQPLRPHHRNSHLDQPHQPHLHQPTTRPGNGPP
jgi:Domain of unknown function (DUF222)